MRRGAGEGAYRRRRRRSERERHTGSRDTDRAVRAMICTQHRGTLHMEANRMVLESLILGAAETWCLDMPGFGGWQQEAFQPDEVQNPEATPRVSGNLGRSPRLGCSIWNEDGQ